MGVKYSDAELHDASKKVMKSLNWMNGKSNKPLAKPAIRNSLGAAEGRISKSARKRRNRQQKANLAGQKMESLLDVVPDVPEPEPVKSAEQRRAAEVAAANQKQHASRRAEQKVVRHEIERFGVRSLDEIRQNIQKFAKDSK